MTHEEMLAYFQTRASEYHEWLKLWIVKENADYVRRAQNLPENPEYIRHRDAVGKIEWYWSEALFCQDISESTCPEEFFQETFWDYMKNFDGDSETPTMRWLIDAFDKAFREVMPSNLHHVLEG
jgi:hypothetical protein